MRTPAATVEGLIARVGPCAATAAHTPMARSRTSTRMAALAIIRERRRGFATWPLADPPLVSGCAFCAGATGMAITIVAGARSMADRGAMAKAPAGTRTSVAGGGEGGRTTAGFSRPEGVVGGLGSYV